MKRFNHKLPKRVYKHGLKIGRLQTLATKRVLPGESISVAANFTIDMAETAREPIMNGMMSIHSYFVPHRHVHGEDYTNFIRQGYDENITFTGIAVPEDYAIAQVREAGTICKDLVVGYNQIWNRYYRDIRNPNDNLNETTVHAGDAAKYGYKTMHIPNIWSRALVYTTDLLDSEREVPVTNNRLDLVDVKKVQAQYKTEIALNWFSNYYKDALKKLYDSPGVSIDADKRPMELIDLNKPFKLKTQSSDGVSTTSGRGMYQYSIPMKQYPEGGYIWILGVLRFPTVCYQEGNYLDLKPNPSFEEMSGQGEIMETLPPINGTPALYFEGQGSNNTLYGRVPYGDWHRWEASYINPEMKNNPGYPVVDFPATAHDAKYINSASYDECFYQAMYGHAAIDGEILFDCWNNIPHALTSIYAGTSL